MLPDNLILDPRPKVVTIHSASDSNAIVVAYKDNVVRIWDMDHHRLQQSFHEIEFESITLNNTYMDSTGKLLTCIFDDGAIAILDMASNEILSAFVDDELKFCFGIPISRNEVVLGWTDRIKTRCSSYYPSMAIFDIESDSWRAEPTEHRFRFIADPDADSLLILSRKGPRILETRSLATLYDNTFFEPIVADVTSASNWLGGSISPDRELFASVELCGRISIWSLKDRNVRGRFEVMPDGCDLKFAWSHDHRWLAIGSPFWGSFTVYDLEHSGRAFRRFVDDGGHFGGMSFLANDRLIATSRQDGIVNLWELQSGRRVADLIAGKFPSGDDFEDEWAIIASDGDIAGSENCHRLFLRRDGGELKPATADAATFQRHEAVRKKLGLPPNEKREEAAEGEWKWKVLDSCFNSEPSSDR